MKKQQFLPRIILFLIIVTVLCSTAVFPKEFKHAKISWKGKIIDALTDEVGIKLKKDAKITKLQEKLGQLGFSLVNQVDDLGNAEIKIPESYGIAKATEDLINSNLIEVAEPIVLTRICRSSNDPFFQSQWGLTKIDANSAWDITTGSSSITIGVLDSGIPMQNGALSHYDLQNTNRITLGGDFIGDGESVRDLCGHGTHVAGILSAESDNSNGITGTSWNTKLYIVQVFDADGLGSSYGFYNGVKDAIDNGAVKIINYSGGATSSDYWSEQGIIYAQNHNVLVVAAAGNISPSNPNGIVVWPAAYSTSYNNLIAVSATTSTDAFASFSSHGSAVTVSAPGANIRSTLPNYTNAYGSINDGYMDGTSMATPFVAGVAGLIMSKNPNLTPAQIKVTLENSAKDLGPAGFDESFGYGRINANDAVRNLYVPQVYSTIQSALNVATSGQKIVVASGTHSISSSLTVSSGITLQINSGASLTFSSGTQLTVYGTLQADGATFTCPNGSSWLGIKLIGANNSSYIKNSTISGFGPGYGADGIYIEDCSPHIEYNYISGAYNGIKIYAVYGDGSLSPVISNNRIEFCTAGNGITVENGTNAQINANIINHNYYHGISVYGNTGNVAIYENTLDNNGYITHTYNGLRAYGSTNIAAWKNTITNSYFGVYSESSSNINFGTGYGNTINPNNDIHDCSYGLVAYDHSYIIGGNNDGEYAGCYNKITSISNYALQSSVYSTIHAKGNYYGPGDVNPTTYKDGFSTLDWTPLWNGTSWLSKAAFSGNNSLDDEDGIISQSFGFIDKGNYNNAKNLLKGIIEKGSIKALNPMLKLFFKSKDIEIKNYFENISSKVGDAQNHYKKALLKIYYGVGEYDSALNIADELISKGNNEVKIDRFLIYALGLRDNNSALSVIDDIKKDFGKDRAEELYTLLLPDGNSAIQNQQNKFAYRTYASSSKPSEYSLSQNYPNPFNPTTVINYQIPKAGIVSLKVYNMLGKEITTLVKEFKTEGKYSVEFNANNLPSGIYICELRANDYVQNKKMMLVK